MEKRLGEPQTWQQQSDEARDREIKTLREAGWTLERIGVAYGISRQRVAQILNRLRDAGS